MPDGTPSVEIIVADMRDWVKDCFEAIGEAELVDVATDEQILKVVSSTYHRGIMGFCDVTYGARWTNAAYETIMVYGTTYTARQMTGN